MGVSERLKEKASSATGLRGRGLPIDEAEVPRLCLCKRACERDEAMVVEGDSLLAGEWV